MRFCVILVKFISLRAPLFKILVYIPFHFLFLRELSVAGLEKRPQTPCLTQQPSGLTASSHLTHRPCVLQVFFDSLSPKCVFYVS